MKRGPLEVLLKKDKHLNIVFTKTGQLFIYYSLSHCVFLCVPFSDTLQFDEVNGGKQYQLLLKGGSSLMIKVVYDYITVITVILLVCVGFKLKCNT